MELVWIARLIVGFAAAMTLVFSWRASLVIVTCLVLELMNIVVAGMPGAGFWNNAGMLLGVGVLLGTVVSIGRERSASYWDYPALALACNGLLTLSWGSGLGDLRDVWVAYVATVVALPAGCFLAAVATDAIRREHRRWRSRSSARE